LNELKQFIAQNNLVLEIDNAWTRDELLAEVLNELEIGSVDEE